MISKAKNLLSNCFNIQMSFAAGVFLGSILVACGWCNGQTYGTGELQEMERGILESSKQVPVQENSIELPELEVPRLDYEPEDERDPFDVESDQDLEDKFGDQFKDDDEGVNTERTPADSSRFSIARTSILNIDLSLDAPDPLPMSVARNEMPTGWTDQYTIRPKNFSWQPPNVHYQRLFFEEPLLERHGYSVNRKWQPVISGLAFFGRGIVLPLDYIKGRQHCLDHSAGWGTPGSYACDQLGYDR